MSATLDQESRVETPLILLVDDFQDGRELYAEYLEFRGFRVVTANDGAAAIAKARELAPAVILMDLTMPGVDGWKATRQLKSDNRTARIPVIALTANAFVDSVTLAREAGCDDVITKPCLPEDLATWVHTFLKGRRHPET